MSDFSREIDTRMPTREEAEVIMRRAHRMRSQMMRNAMVGTWAMLQRAINRKGTGRAPRHV